MITDLPRVGFGRGFITAVICEYVLKSFSYIEIFDEKVKNRKSMWNISIYKYIQDYI